MAASTQAEVLQVAIAAMVAPGRMFRQRRAPTATWESRLPRGRVSAFPVTRANGPVTGPRVVRAARAAATPQPARPTAARVAVALTRAPARQDAQCAVSLGAIAIIYS